MVRRALGKQRFAHTLDVNKLVGAVSRSSFLGFDSFDTEKGSLRCQMQSARPLHA